MSIKYTVRDSNPRPSEHESPPRTTKTGAHAQLMIMIVIQIAVKAKTVYSIGPVGQCTMTSAPRFFAAHLDRVSYTRASSSTSCPLCGVQCDRPDLAKFHRVGKYLKIFDNMLKVYLALGHFGTIYMLFANLGILLQTAK